MKGGGEERKRGWGEERARRRWLIRSTVGALADLLLVCLNAQRARNNSQ